MISLKRSLTKQLITVTILIILVYTVLLFTWLFTGIEFANEVFVKRDSQRYKQWFEANPQMILPQGDKFGVYLGFDALPEQLKVLFDKSTLAPGKLARRRVRDNTSGGSGKRILMVPTQVKNDKRWLYVINILPGIPKDGPVRELLKVVGIYGVLILLVMFVFAKRLYWMIIKPLDELERLAKSAADNTLIPPSELLTKPNEFGMLARTFAQSVERINALNQREKTFLENVSHELRTPIAVVKSSLELVDIRINKGNYNITQPLARLADANQTMVELTEAMLWLARSTHQPISDSDLERFDFAALTEQIWQQLSYLNDKSLNEKNITLQLIQPMQQHLLAAKNLVAIVLTNLLRNAIEHNQKDIVLLQFENDTLVISNHCESLCEQQIEQLLQRGHSENECFGLGLNIVQQICDKQQWGLQLRNDQQMLSIEIVFTQTG